MVIQMGSRPVDVTRVRLPLQDNLHQYGETNSVMMHMLDAKCCRVRLTKCQDSSSDSCHNNFVRSEDD